MQKAVNTRKEQAQDHKSMDSTETSLSQRSESKKRRNSAGKKTIEKHNPPKSSFGNIIKHKQQTSTIDWEF
jgi:hypothetical protein